MAAVGGSDAARAGGAGGVASAVGALQRSAELPLRSTLLLRVVSSGQPRLTDSPGCLQLQASTWVEGCHEERQFPRFRVVDAGPPDDRDFEGHQRRITGCCGRVSRIWRTARDRTPARRRGSWIGRLCRGDGRPRWTGPGTGNPWRSFPRASFGPTPTGIEPAELRGTASLRVARWRRCEGPAAPCCGPPKRHRP